VTSYASNHQSRYLQNILKFAKCRPPFEGRGKRIMDSGISWLGPTLRKVCYRLLSLDMQFFRESERVRARRERERK